MRLILGKFLIVCILLAQTAGVIHAADSVMPDSAVAIAQAETGNPADDTGDCCKHLCHSNAHFVAIIFSEQENIPAAAATHHALLGDLYTLAGYQPPIPPPIR